ncbi:hypothetical protein J4G08_15895 [Candidatus Poribacteria bacterium]|nr:hypothetical protein [Candidatus Poribacteria bacterium]
MERIFRWCDFSTFYNERTIVFTTVVASGDFRPFSTTTFWANYHAAQGRACTLAITRTACAAPLCFSAFLSGRKSLVAHGLIVFASLICMWHNLNAEVAICNINERHFAAETYSKLCK